MALKSIISVDVDDSAFQRFSAMFAKYQEQLKNSPSMWQDVGKEVQTAGLSFKELLAALLAQTELGATLADQQHKAGAAADDIHAKERAAAAERAKQAKDAQRAADAQAKAWREMAQNARGFATRVGEATRSLLQWGALSGLISGIVGAGGLFGIDRLATSAGNARRSSLGLGLSPGEQNAFAVNYGRVVDPGTFLGGVNEAMHDVTKRVGLYGAGLTEGDIAGKDTGEVGAELIPALKKIADQTPESMMAQVLKSRHLDQFVSLEDFERLKRTSADELGGYGQSYQTDRRTLDLNQQQQKAWQDLQVQLHRAGESIETAFIRGLTPLAPQIGRLSAAFTGLVEVFLNNPHVKEWIDGLSTALGRFAAYIGTPQFATDISTFVAGVADLAGGLKRAVEWIVSWFPAAGPDGTPDNPKLNPQKQKDAQTPGTPLYNQEHAPGEPGWGYTPGLGWHWTPNTPLGSSPDQPLPSSESPTNRPAPRVFAAIEHEQGLPTGLLNQLEFQESGFLDKEGPLTKTGERAQGYFQFMKTAAGQYNINPHDETGSAFGAARYLGDLRKQFGGDLDKAIAAYNLGPTALSTEINQYGDKWREHLPPATSAYLARATTALEALAAKNNAGGTKVTVHDQTGGNVVVNASQVAH